MLANSWHFGLPITSLLFIVVLYMSLLEKDTLAQAVKRRRQTSSKTYPTAKRRRKPIASMSNNDIRLIKINDQKVKPAQTIITYKLSTASMVTLSS